jgi:hypothetical protein
MQQLNDDCVRHILSYHTIYVMKQLELEEISAYQLVYGRFFNSQRIDVLFTNFYLNFQLRGKFEPNRTSQLVKYALLKAETLSLLNLTDEMCDTIVKYLRNTNLEYLSLEGYVTSKFLSLIFTNCPNLKQFVYHGSATRVPSNYFIGLGQLKHLEKVNLKNTELYDTELSYLKSCSCLKSFIMSFSRGFALGTLTNLLECPSITSIDASECYEDLDIPANVISSKCPTLLKLSFSISSIDSSNLLLLARTAKNLTHLYLDAKITGEYRLIQALLFGKLFPKLQHLAFREVNDDTLSLLKHRNELKSIALIAQFPMLDGYSAQPIAELPFKMEKLYFGSSISNQNILLAHCETLTELNISSNYMVEQCLPKCINLQKLTLRNGLSTPFNLNLLFNLKKLQSLTFDSIEGTYKLGPLLSQFPNLKSLDFVCKEIDTVSMRALRAQSNYSIETITITAQMNDEVLYNLLNYLKVVQSIHVSHASGVPLRKFFIEEQQSIESLRCLVTMGSSVTSSDADDILAQEHTSFEFLW